MQNTGIDDIKEAGAAVQHGAIAIALRLMLDRQDDPATAERLAKLATEDGRFDELFDLARAISPAGCDELAWQRWLNGGKSPAEHVLKQFGSGSAGSGKKIQGAAKRVADAAARTRLALMKLETAEDAMKRAQREVEAAKKDEREEEEALAGLNAFATLRLMNELLAGPFAMGPAWTIMRCLSGYIRPDPEWRSSLQKDDLAIVEKWAAERRAKTTKMLMILDLMAGDEEFEMIVHQALYESIGHYEAKARERGQRRTTAEQKASIRVAA
jgi:hypothetical protein